MYADERDFAVPDKDIPYEKRLAQGIEAISSRLKESYSDKTELDNAFSDLFQALDCYAEVYMEIGIKSGIKLYSQIMAKEDFKD